MNSSSMELGPIGIWTAQFEYQPAAKAQQAAAELERLGLPPGVRAEQLSLEQFIAIFSNLR